MYVCGDTSSHMYCKFHRSSCRCTPQRSPRKNGQTTSVWCTVFVRCYTLYYSAPRIFLLNVNIRVIFLFKFLGNGSKALRCVLVWNKQQTIKVCLPHLSAVAFHCLVHSGPGAAAAAQRKAQVHGLVLRRCCSSPARSALRSLRSILTILFHSFLNVLLSRNRRDRNRNKSLVYTRYQFEMRLLVANVS